MTATTPILLKMATQIGLLVLVVSMALTVYRIVRGPKSADRIIALDLALDLLEELERLRARLRRLEG